MKVRWICQCRSSVSARENRGGYPRASCSACGRKAWRIMGAWKKRGRYWFAVQLDRNGYPKQM